MELLNKPQIAQRKGSPPGRKPSVSVESNRDVSQGGRYNENGWGGGLRAFNSGEPALQPKLKVGKPGYPFEREEDQVGDIVFHKEPVLQRKDASPDALGIEFNQEMQEAEQNAPPKSVAEQIIENYNNSTNQMPGGDCYAVCKDRLLEAYKEVVGHSLYEDLPAEMQTQYFSARKAFNFIYHSASGQFAGWTTMPEEYRGKGAAGAIAWAGMGELKDETQIWNGELEPGAVLQVWGEEKGFEVVRDGRSEDDYAYGHSFIFLSYERDDQQNITGMNIADQGYQSYQALTQDSWEVWFGANLTVEAPEAEGIEQKIPMDSLKVPTPDLLNTDTDGTNGQ